MSICPACGKENEDSWGSRTRCADCGSELPAGTRASISDELSALALSEEEAVEAAEPPAAPGRTGKACARCRTINPAEARFCFECGTPFVGSPAAAGAPDEPAPDASPEPFLEDQPPPFTVTVVVEKGCAQG